MMTAPEMNAPTPLADTPRPLLILTPELNSSPDEHTFHLLKELVESHLESDEVYIITKCDYVSPEGTNYLFTIKPYYWEEPGIWGTSLPLLLPLFYVTTKMKYRGSRWAWKQK